MSLGVIGSGEQKFFRLKKTVVFKQKTLAWQNVPNINQFPVTLFMFEGHFSEEKKISRTV